MKSSMSVLTDSIENHSLPSIPVQRHKEERSTVSQSAFKELKESKLRQSFYNRVPTPVSSKLTAKILNHHRSFPNTALSKQSKPPELNKINEYAVLKVYEHRDFGNSPSTYSRMSEDISTPNLRRSKSWMQNKSRFYMPNLTSHYCKMDTNDEGIYSYREPKGCIYLPKLPLEETEFLRLVNENNVEAVHKYIEDHPALNINCVNFQGISALHIAVRNRSEEMVEFLLKYPRTEIGDTVLHAIRDNSIKILVILLEKRKKVSPGLEFAGATHSTLYPEHVTPLILAAQLNNYRIVNLLISRGHTINRPHSPICECINCQNCVVNEDGLHASSARLSVYRAVSSPAYLVHVSADPILEAFYLTQELAANAASYRHLAAEYLELKDKVSEFAVELIGNCRTSNEVELILRQTTGCEGNRHFLLPRLLMAVTYKQKEFVAHPNTQQVLESFWLGEWYSWRSKSSISKMLIVLCRIFMLPLILLFSLVLPRHRILKHYQIPLNKLITHATSYFVFLALVFYISNQDKSRLKRGPPNTGAEGPVILYVCGYTWSAVRMCLMQGPRRFFTAMWCCAEIIMLTLFWLTFYFWFKSAIDVVNNGEKYMMTERKYWSQYDATLLAEGTFCLATIFAYFRLMFLCQLNYHLGPLQVSLGKMTLDIYKYIIVFAIIISAFAAGLARFYQYYHGMVYEDKYGMKSVQVSSFTSLTDTLNTLFWALFCMAPLESADIVLENTGNTITKKSDMPPENRHKYTERIGYFCFGCFEVISVIVVLNMLIATMSNTFQRVNNNVAIEWTFGKTEVYIDYMWQTTLPSPLNLIPTTSGIGSLIDWLQIKICKPPGARARWSPSYCCFIERDIEANLQKEFPALMTVIVQRYFSQINENIDLKTVHRDINFIKCSLNKDEP